MPSYNLNLRPTWDQHGALKTTPIMEGPKSYHLIIATKVCRPKTNRILKPTLCTTCIHLEAPNASKCMHVVHSVGFRVA